MRSLNVKTEGQGHPILLLHGFGFDHSIWEGVVQSLGSHYKMIRVDLPGHGLTPTMTWHEFKRELLSVLPDQFSMLGWSLGGLFATRLALEAPEQVTHLFLTNTSPYFIHDGAWPGIEPRILKAFYRHISYQPEQVLQKFIAEQCRRTEENAPKTLSEIPKTLPALSGLKAGLDVLLTWDFRDQIVNLTMPVCYVFGGLDAIVPKATLGALQTHLSAAEFHLIPEGAHALFLSHANLFQTTVREFIQ